MLDPALSLLIGGALALLFANAAWHKLRDLRAFRGLFEAYQLVAPRAGGVAVLVPLLELLIALGLLVPSTRGLAAGAGAALLFVYALALAVNLRRGRHELSCGCGGFAERQPIARWMVLRNLVLATALAASASVAARPLQPVDGLTIGVGVLVAALLYASIDRLLGQLGPRSLALRDRA